MHKIQMAICCSGAVLLPVMPLAPTGKIDKLSGGVCQSDDFAAVKARMAAGFRDLCGKGEGEAS